MRHADFGLSGKFDFAVSGTVQRKSLHIHISKKPPLISRLRNIKGGCRRQPDCHFIITAASAFTLPSAKVLLTVYFSPSKE